MLMLMPSRFLAPMTSTWAATAAVTVPRQPSASTRRRRHPRADPPRPCRTTHSTQSPPTADGNAPPRRLDIRSQASCHPDPPSPPALTHTTKPPSVPRAAHSTASTTLRPRANRLLDLILMPKLKLAPHAARRRPCQTTHPTQGPPTAGRTPPPQHPGIRSQASYHTDPPSSPDQTQTTTLQTAQRPARPKVSPKPCCCYCARYYEQQQRQLRRRHCPQHVVAPTSQTLPPTPIPRRLSPARRALLPFPAAR